MAQRFVIEYVGGEEIEVAPVAEDIAPIHRIGIRFGDAHDSVVWLETGLGREVQVYSPARRLSLYPQSSNTFYIKTET